MASRRSARGIHATIAIMKVRVAAGLAFTPRNLSRNTSIHSLTCTTLRDTDRTMPPAPSPAVLKLQALQKDFQQIASMAGFLNSALDGPQLRLFFTLFGRMTLKDAAEGEAIAPRLQQWCDQLSLRLREDSSSAILPPQIQISAPQLLPNGESWYMVATVSFTSKVTENSYQRVRTAVLAAYQAAAALREKGFQD